MRTTAEQEEIKKRERAIKVAQYKADFAIVSQKVSTWFIMCNVTCFYTVFTISQFIFQRKGKILDDELLTVTKRMLLNNSDIYTLWNIRRQVFVNNKW